MAIDPLVYCRGWAVTVVFVELTKRPRSGSRTSISSFKFYLQMYPAYISHAVKSEEGKMSVNLLDSLDSEWT